MSFQTLRIYKICRTCLSEKEIMRSLFSMDSSLGETVKLFEMLMSCTSLQVMENDGLPLEVCLQCVDHITSAFSFKQLCEKSDNTLREILEKRHETFLELEPSLTNLDRVTESYTQVISALSETNGNAILPNLTDDINVKDENEFQNDLEFEISESDTGLQNANECTTKQNPILSAVSNEFDREDVQVSENDLNVKFEICEHDLQNYSDINIKEDDKDFLDLQSGLDIKEEKNRPQETPKDETEQPLYPCEYCTLVFVSKSDQMGHKTVHRFCDMCNKTFSSFGTFSRHYRFHVDSKYYNCKECGKNFIRSDYVTRHIRTHTLDKPTFASERTFVCEVCEKTFLGYSSFMAHDKVHSSPDKCHQCSVCGSQFSGAQFLAIHMKIHKGRKNYLCPYCPRAFMHLSNLVNHKRMHIGEQPSVCKECNKKFPDLSSLIVHMRCHSGEKPYVCNTCGRGCVSSFQLKQHIRNHTLEKPYKCSLCPKSFITPRDLKVHAKWHSGRRDQICPHCSKGFYRASDLNRHMRIHSKERRHICNICAKAFIHSKYLKNHMKIHTKAQVKVEVKQEVCSS